MKAISFIVVCLLLGACGESTPVKSSSSSSAYKKVSYTQDKQSLNHQQVMDKWVADQMNIR